MKAGVFTVILGSMPFEKALDYAASRGFQAVELGAGGWAGTSHCDPDALLASNRKTKDFLKAITSRGLEISSLNVAGTRFIPTAR